MKKIITVILSLAMLLSFAACSAQNTDTETTPPVTEEVNASVNEGELQIGVYTGTATYTSGEFSMTWNMVIDFNEDNTFVLNNEKGEEKGSGTYALTDSCYTMTYSDDRTCTFVVKEDGTLEVTEALPYGQNSIGLEEVGGIVLSFHGDSYEFAAAETDAATGATHEANGASVAAGTYAASYTKESQMAGTVTYNYTAELGEDGSFSYAVTFDMKGTMYDGSSASGTYTVEDGKFVFTDTEGNVIEGAVTAENTFVISLMVSEMASDPYEVSFVPATASDAAATVAAGAYAASYTKESQMAGTVTYNYTAELGEDGSFSYAVTFDMKGTMYDGSSASGTYAVEDGKFVFTDTEGNVIEGAVTDENTFVISLMASEMSSDPYEVTFAPAE